MLLAAQVSTEDGEVYKAEVISTETGEWLMATGRTRWAALYNVLDMLEEREQHLQESGDEAEAVRTEPADD